MRFAVRKMSLTCLIISSAAVIAVAGCKRSDESQVATTPAKPVVDAPAPPAQVPAGAVDSPADETYGYTRGNPVKLGYPNDPSEANLPEGMRGPEAEQVYLRHLLDETSQPVSFERIGSFGGGPDEHMVDGYRVRTRSGRTFELYFDMYHPELDPLKQPAPKGLSLAP